MVDALGLSPLAVCANGAVLYDSATDRIVSAHTLSPDALGELAEIATRVIPGVGLAVERVGRTAFDESMPQFASSPGYEHAWHNPDNTEVSVEDMLSVPAVKLLIRKGHRVHGAHVLVLGITFKENCPDIRNSHVVDVIRELEEFGCRVAACDPWADPEEVRHEYGLELLPALDGRAPFAGFDAVVLAVAHEKFKALDFDRIEKDTTVVFDIKAFLGRKQVDGRL